MAGLCALHHDVMSTGSDGGVVNGGRRTVPHAHRTVAAATYECIAPELYGAHKVLIHVPGAVRERWCRDGEGSCGRCGAWEQVVRDRRAWGRWLRM